MKNVNENLVALAGGIAVYVDGTAEVPYCLHFFEITVRGQNTKGDNLNLYGEVVAVRDDFTGHAADRFAVVPADCLLDLPAHPTPPTSVAPVAPGAAMDFVKSTYQSERRQLCQEERLHFVQVCRDYSSWADCRRGGWTNTVQGGEKSCAGSW